MDQNRKNQEKLVPVMKYWQYTPSDLKNNKMYALLPLQVFKSRKKIISIYHSHHSETFKRQLITKEFDQLKETIRRTIAIIGDLYDHQEIYSGDLERILRVITNITEYLYNRYGEYKTLSEEVYHMVKTLYDPRVEERGMQKGRKQGREQGIRQERRDMICEFLLEHGAISDDLKARIEQEDDLQTLRQWVKLAAKAHSITEFKIHINQK